jgi:hypothetical protein
MMFHRRRFVFSGALVIAAACNTSTDPEPGSAKLVVRNKLQVPITSAYVLGCADAGMQLTDSLSDRETIHPNAERAFRMVTAGCYDALFVREHTVQNSDNTNKIQVDTVGIRAHMILEPHDIYIVTLAPQ